ncbi:MAG: MATE family efflux transporter [Corallococcus sp.]|nr:MATE family efflux transporter [Corallococcus sp.]
MKHAIGKHEMNLTEGSIFKKLIIFALPLMATNILQLLFNVADVAVLGIAGYDIGPVGSTGALINLIIGLFVGLSVSANVLVARFVGSDEKERAERVVGISVLFALAVGAFLAVVGVLCSRTFLSWMNCPSEFLDDATTYMQIYFIGMPIVLLYNFCASIMRAVGDTFRPLIYLIIAGVVNVGLNFLLTYVSDMGVAGVAIATVASQLVSVVLAMISLIRSKGFAHFSVKNMRFFKSEFVEMLKIGLPAGLQGCVFSLSNVVIMSTINSFGTVAVNGNTLGAQFDGFIYNAMNAIALSCMAFVSQNLGAKNVARIRKTVGISLCVVTVVGLAVCGVVLLVARPVAVLIKQPSDVIEYAIRYRLLLLGTTYFTCGLMEVMSYTMRGLGKSTLAMIVSLSGSCLFRILWIYTVCKWVTEIPAAYYALYWVYPVSWVLTFAIFIAMYFPAIKKVQKRLSLPEDGVNDALRGNS